jgi:hypothetical protein
MRVAVPPLFRTPSWRGASLHRDKFTFTVKRLAADGRHFTATAVPRARSGSHMGSNYGVSHLQLSRYSAGLRAGRSGI